jgi:hypothetical protein
MYESGLHSIEGAKASSSQARDQLSKTTIFSPLDGVVTVLNSKARRTGRGDEPVRRHRSHEGGGFETTCRRSWM